jgi:hypothetical protein
MLRLLCLTFRACNNAVNALALCNATFKLRRKTHFRRKQTCMVYPCLPPCLGHCQKRSQENPLESSEIQSIMHRFFFA